VTASIEIVLSSPRWQAALPRLEPMCRRFVAAALAAPSGDGTRTGDVRVALADDAAAHDLNRRFRGIDKPTNVMSFPAHGSDTHRASDPSGLGDILVAFETTAREAKSQRIALADHLAHLLVHGVLHLRGHDHERAAEAEIMEALETDILVRFGVADPYGGSIAERRS